ncbi:MAG: hypothetical protein AAFS12_19035 [Cyanobacteria bacterium J06632_19]
MVNVVNIPVELPSGKILNIARFIALIPINKANNISYDLILEGHSTPVHLESQDGEILKKILFLHKNSVAVSQSEEERQKQLQQNERAMTLLKQRMKRHENISETESIQREEVFNDFKQIMDTERLPGQKLYSEE